MTSAEYFKDEHDWVASQLTDLLTGRVDPETAERVNRHLASCQDCAAGLEIERRLREHIRRPATVEHTPAASFAKLKARLADTGAAKRTAPRHGRWQRRLLSLSLAASLAALAISLFSLTASHSPRQTARFQTLSKPAPAQGELHVGFSKGATSAEIEQALAGVGGRIISGPSAAGVYRIAIGEALPVSRAIEILAAQQAVRFVVPTPEALDD